MAESNQTVTINDKEYNVEDFSDNARALLSNIRVADAKIQQLNQELGLIRTARQTFSQALTKEVPDLADNTESESPAGDQ